MRRGIALARAGDSKRIRQCEHFLHALVLGSGEGRHRIKRAGRAATHGTSTVWNHQRRLRAPELCLEGLRIVRRGEARTSRPQRGSRLPFEGMVQAITQRHAIDAEHASLKAQQVQRMQAPPRNSDLSNLVAPKLRNVRACPLTPAFEA